MTYIERNWFVDLAFNRIEGEQAARCTARGCTLTTVKYVIIWGAMFLTF